MNTFYEVKNMNKKIIGIDLGGTSIKFAILTQNGEIQEKWYIPTTILDSIPAPSKACLTSAPARIAAEASPP